MGEGRERSAGPRPRRPLPLKQDGTEELGSALRVRRDAGCRPPLPVSFSRVVEFMTGGREQIVRLLDAWWLRARGWSPSLAFGGGLFDWGKEGPPEPYGPEGSRERYSQDV